MVCKNKNIEKTITKYNVEFYGTNEIATMNKNYMYLYKDNKTKFPIEYVALRQGKLQISISRNSKGQGG